MKATEMLNQVKNLLGVELSDIQLAELKLENGTVLEADTFESGKEVFIRTEDDKVALPVGEYELEDNRILVVEEEGVIKEIKAEEHDDKEEEEKEVDMEYVSREEFKKEIDEIKGMIEKMMDHGDKKKEEMSSQVAEQVSLAVTEVLNEEAKIKEELSAPAVEPMKHNPEVQTSNIKVKFAQKRGESTLDRVMNNIAKLNNK